jgi:hypothetical protein
MVSLARSQSLDSFLYLGDPYGNQGYCGVMFSMNTTGNPVVVNAAGHRQSDAFGEVNFKRHDFDLLGFRYDVDAKVYFDIIHIFVDVSNASWETFYRREGTGFSTGLTGWHSFGWNAFVSDRLCIAPGFNHNDYFYGVSVRDEADLGRTNPSLTTPEPQGYYFAAGPVVFADVLINQYLLLHFKGNYSFSYWKADDLTYADKDPSYPLPHFYGFTTELTTPWGVFFEVDHQQIINKGNIPNRGRRTDFNLGFKFVFD